MYNRGNTQLGAEPKPSTNVFAGLIESGFGLYNRIKSMEYSEDVRKRMEAVAKAQADAQIAQAQAMQRAAQQQFLARTAAPQRTVAIPTQRAGMNVGTMAMWGGGALLAIAVVMQLARQAQKKK